MEEEMEEDITDRLNQPRGLSGEEVTPTRMPGEGITPMPTLAVPPVLPRQEGLKDGKRTLVECSYDNCGVPESHYMSTTV